jgi:cyclase
MGDLVTENLHVPIHNPDEFIYYLQKVKQMDIEILISGHGTIGDQEMPYILADYLSFISDKSQETMSPSTFLFQIV